MQALNKQEHQFIGILLCGISTLPHPPFPPTFSLDPSSILAQHSGCFQSYTALGKQDCGTAVAEVRVFFLAVTWVSVNESKHELSQMEAPCPRTCQPPYMSKAPFGLPIGAWGLQQDMCSI